jgi:hypothetical protein
MKRKFTLLSLLIIFSTLSFGQITSNDMQSIGDTVIYQTINKNTFDPLLATTGVGVTWDYHAVYEAAGNPTYYFIDPLTTPPPANDTFALSTVAEAVDGATGNFFYSLNGANFYRDGIWDPSSIMIKYNNKLKLYTLPFQFGTMFTDTYTGVGNMTGGIDSVYINNGGYSLDVQGIGTLILPTGTFDSVFRVFYTEDFAVKFDLLGPGTTIFAISEWGFEYWKPGVVKPILVYIESTYTDMGGANQLTKSVRYNKLAIPDIAVGIAENNQPEVGLYPNPTNGDVNISLSTGAISTIEICDMVGKTVFSAQIKNNQARIDCSMLNQGVYFLKVTDDNGNISTQKLIKK